MAMMPRQRARTAAAWQANLSRLLGFAALNSPFYRDQGWAARLRAGQSVSFGELPFTAKETVKAETLRFHAEKVPASEGLLRSKATTGSTGVPLVVVKSERHHRFNLLENERLRRGWDYGAQAGHVHTAPPSASEPPGTVAQAAAGHWTIYSYAPKEIIALLAETQASSILFRPSVAVSVLEGGADLSFLRLISTVGEILPPELAPLIAGLGQCLHHDTYGSVETGIIAASCKECGNYHLADRHLIAELLDDADRPVPPGAMGRVVVTPLFNLAMPLIRYELGDYAVRATRSDCPAGRLALSRIVGRSRNLFILPDGSRRAPNIAPADLIAAGIARHKLVQTSRSEVEFRYVTLDPAGELKADVAQALIARNLSPGLTAIPVKVADLGRAPGGKYLMHECLVGA